MLHAFKIDKDHIDVGRAGMLRGLGEPEELRAIPDRDFYIKFRLYDDDDILYYEGRATTFDAVEEAHDFAKHDAGVTRSQIYHKGRWIPFIG